MTKRCLFVFVMVSAFSIRHSALTAAPQSSLLSLYLLSHRIGQERSETTTTADGSVLRSHFEYLDRGTKVALDSTLTYAPDFTPLSFESHGKSYRYFAVDASVPAATGARGSFTAEGVAPISVQALLVRYWLTHGRPASIRIEPSGDIVTVRERPDTIVSFDHLGRQLPPLRQFTIDGVAWGRQRFWLNPEALNLVAAVSSVGVLGFEAMAEPNELQQASALTPQLFIRTAVHDRLREAAVEARAISPVQRGTFALTGGRLIDATGAAPIERATVIVRGGRIEAAGPADTTRVPQGVPSIDVAGKTILPGLWDMHAHAGLAEWGPVYLASGVTTARDMGGEFDVVTALRDAWRDGTALGPRLLLAGLVDGPGPASFGHVTAANPDEGRAVVRKYKDAGFQQMKLYSLLDKPTVGAVIDAAHAAGMTVTGHIPTGLTMREVVEMGMDHIAHLTVRDAPGSEALRETIAFLKAHGTVIDPTLSWNELLGRSAATPIESFQPGFRHAAAPLQRLIAGANGGSVTPEQARDRLSRSLQIVKALHDAGIPIVAGTDKGVPGVSVAREIELYVQAGLTPIDAIRAATAVPARVMGLVRDSGTIAPGLRADLIVVDGNPLERIGDIRNVRLVAANGCLYDAAALWSLGGFRLEPAPIDIR
jgi:imidazolonepropionase-like amidohydrolase